ncbi:alanine racemase [Halalkalibacter krulwichiae]|uniref:Alanine racemase n=1 Tax=Halalkalibacter krulwichiae TaxID=199441 RepID=A0A1X9MJ90_9BACI|nr:alanine racemase [Halalkalibacter krulwichiae]ARK32864.1 Alanine racemase [Halalkalibacter krulwichiae]
MKRRSFRNTFAQISLQAIEENAAAFKGSLQPGCKLMAVVKGDGYGHGAVAAARSAIRGGANYLGVAILDEAIQLREAGITAPILVLGYTAPFALKTAIDKDITITVFSKEVCHALLELVKTTKKRVKVHMKIETGMGRVGIQTPKDLLELTKPLYQHPAIEVEGVFTHFACADNLNSSYTDEQFSTFLTLVEKLEEEGIAIPIKHCCNSAGTLFHKDKHLSMVRVGISLYGLKPDQALDLPITLTQAMKLYSSIVSIRTLAAGSTISYGRTFTLPTDSMVATLPIGYADGLSRSLSNKGVVMINETQVPIIGRVCMDQTMIDISKLSNVQVDDLVEFPIDDMAEKADTINYEIVCAISKRVPRYYESSETPTPLSLKEEIFV